jgi:hypothetical protein
MNNKNKFFSYGGVLLGAGITHFGKTIDGVVNQNQTWDNASNYSGLTLSGTIYANFTTGSSNSAQYQQHKIAEINYSVGENGFVGLHNKSNNGGDLTMNDYDRIVANRKIASPMPDDVYASLDDDLPFKNQYGKKSISLYKFRCEYAGCLETEIIVGESTKFGYKFPNKIQGNGSFVLINTGDEVDMTHFMVVGRRGETMGVINELTQIGTKSFFYGQDLYSNKLGIEFFKRYDESIKKNPYQITEYIYWFLSNPDNTKH